jgi:hypothetical protein
MDLLAGLGVFGALVLIALAMQAVIEFANWFFRKRKSRWRK